MNILIYSKTNIKVEKYITNVSILSIYSSILLLRKTKESHPLIQIQEFSSKGVKNSFN